jgi:Polysaccharide deacetylase
MQLLSADEITVESRVLDAKIAAFSLDLETDFGTGRTQALSQLPQFVDLMADLDVPWTTFVEGQFFEHKRDIVGMLRDRGVDLQLHCYDHGQPGDTPEALRRSVAVYADFMGRKPTGYRAHTYRLTRALFDTLIEEGFLWDSSLMRAFAQGRNPHRGFSAGDYLVLNRQLIEFPVGTWRGLPIALNHTHLLLAKTPGELLLRAVSGPTPLVVYNFHMTDLVRCDSLLVAARTPVVKMLYRYLWSTHGRDTFPIVRQFVGYLRRRGYAMATMSQLYERVVAN